MLYFSRITMRLAGGIKLLVRSVHTHTAQRKLDADRTAALPHPLGTDSRVRSIASSAAQQQPAIEHQAALPHPCQPGGPSRVGAERGGAAKDHQAAPRARERDVQPPRVCQEPHRARGVGPHRAEQDDLGAGRRSC